MAVRRKVTSKDKAPEPIVQLRGGFLRPLTAYDAEIIGGMGDGQEFDLVPRSQRSNPQNRLYWQLLRKIVAGSGRWPTEAHLHNDLKMATGYWRWGIDMKTRTTVRIIDSTAFDKMRHEEFRAYFDRALEVLTDYLGHDPMEVLKDDG